MTRNVLMVEADEAMSVALRDGFTFEGYAVAVARDGAGGPERPLKTIRFGEVLVDFAGHEARKGEDALDLSPREFQLLDYFYRHRGQVVTREQLLDHVWGYDHIPFTRTVDTHIAKLRKKIEDQPSDPRWILTIHRLGYKFLG